MDIIREAENDMARSNAYKKAWERLEDMMADDGSVSAIDFSDDDSIEGAELALVVTMLLESDRAFAISIEKVGCVTNTKIDVKRSEGIFVK